MLRINPILRAVEPGCCDDNSSFYPLPCTFPVSPFYGRLGACDGIALPGDELLLKVPTLVGWLVSLALKDDVGATVLFVGAKLLDGAALMDGAADGGRVVVGALESVGPELLESAKDGCSEAEGLQLGDSVIIL